MLASFWWKWEAQQAQCSTGHCIQKILLQQFSAYMADIVQVTSTASALKRHGVTEDSCEISAHIAQPPRALVRAQPRRVLSVVPHSQVPEFSENTAPPKDTARLPIKDKSWGWYSGAAPRLGLPPSAECHSHGKSRCLDGLHNPHQFFSCLAYQILLPPLCFFSPALSLSLSLARLL